jgi:glycosyltransferase involved in cell wall biosynthesis
VYTRNLCASLVKLYDINLEVWYHSFNDAPVRRIFSDLPKERVTFVTEKNFKEALMAETHLANALGEINERNYWNFPKAARLFSKADVFYPAIAYLDDVAYTGKSTAVVLHDVFTSSVFELFSVGKHGNEVYRATQEQMENIARRGANFVMTSKVMALSQLNYIRNIDAHKINVVVTPKNAPNSGGFLCEREIREIIGIKGKYLFYPTQIRPHKNFRLLIRAFSRLLKCRPSLKLVITGDLNDVENVARIANELKVERSIVTTQRLSIKELYSCYKYASCVPVSTMCEAGLPWQAIEASAMGTPFVLTNAEMNVGEIEEFGLRDTIPLIDGKDDGAFATEIEWVLNNRDAAVRRQEPLREALLKRTWDDAAREYYEIFERVVYGETIANC